LVDVRRPVAMVCFAVTGILRQILHHRRDPNLFLSAGVFFLDA
jgi:hypothetical protein